MIALEGDFGKVYMSRDSFADRRAKGHWGEYSHDVFVGMFNTRQYVSKFEEFTIGKSPKISVLDAHGNTSRDEWFYFDGDEAHLVQDWIDEHDGEADALVLFPCNPRILPIESTKSLVLHQRGTGAIESYRKRLAVARMYVPGEGYIDPDPTKLEIRRSLLYTEFSLQLMNLIKNYRKARSFAQNVVL